MKLVLDYNCPMAGRRLLWLRHDEKVLVGNTSQADLQIESDNQMAAQHFAIEGHAKGWRAIAVSPNSASIRINGQIASSHELLHGDVITAGITSFNISIEGDRADGSDASAGDTATETAASEIGLEFTSQIHSSKVIEIEVVTSVQCETQVLNSLSQSEAIYFAVNRKRLGDQVDLADLESEDLFESAPEEIRATDSLSVTPVDLNQGTDEVQRLIQAARKDAASFIVSPLDHQGLLESQKLFWAWYARPSLLHFHLTKGSQELASKLLVDIRCLVTLPQGNSTNLTLFTTEQNRERIETVLDKWQAAKAIG